MAWYDNDWQDQEESAGWWPGSWRGRGPGRRPWSWTGGAGRGGTVGYGGAYGGRAPGGWRSTHAPGGTGYDFDYQGGEWGRPVNARGFGTRGSNGPPRRWGPGEALYRGRYRTENTGYDREFNQESERARWAPRPYRSAGRPGYALDFDEEDRLPGYDAEYRQGRSLGSGGRQGGSDDFGGSLRRHYGRTPVDRWPARASAWSDRQLDDDDVREAVRENLFHDSYIAPERIDVDVDRGVVTLRGEVDDFLEARYAWDDAWESPGVRGVVNHLTVRTDRASDEMDMPQSTGGHSAEGPTRGARGRGRRGR